MTEYEAETSNASNKVTATPEDPEAELLIELNGEEIENESSAEWEAGENELVITVTNGTAEKVYTVTVMKS